MWENGFAGCENADVDGDFGCEQRGGVVLGFCRNGERGRGGEACRPALPGQRDATATQRDATVTHRPWALLVLGGWEDAIASGFGRNRNLFSTARCLCATRRLASSFLLFWKRASSSPNQTTAESHSHPPNGFLYSLVLPQYDMWFFETKN